VLSRARYDDASARAAVFIDGDILYACARKARARRRYGSARERRVFTSARMRLMIARYDMRLCSNLSR